MRPLGSTPFFFLQFLIASTAALFLVPFPRKIMFLSRLGRRCGGYHPLEASFFFLLVFFFLPSSAALIIMVVTSWLSVGYHLVISDDQVEGRLWWVAGGSSHTFVAESPDVCARAVMGVSHFSLVSSLSSLFTSLCPQCLRSVVHVLAQCRLWFSVCVVLVPGRPCVKSGVQPHPFWSHARPFHKPGPAPHTRTQLPYTSNGL